MVRLKTDQIIILVIAFGSLFIDYNISLGIILGHLFSLFNFYLLKQYFEGLTKINIMTFLGPILRLLVNAIPLLVSVLFPNIFNVFGTAFGLLYNVFYIMVKGIIQK